MEAAHAASLADWDDEVIVHGLSASVVAGRIARGEGWCSPELTHGINRVRYTT